jgi:hypothetical protein
MLSAECVESVITTPLGVGVENVGLNREEPGSNLDRDTEYPDRIIHNIPALLKTNSETVP